MQSQRIAYALIAVIAGVASTASNCRPGTITVTAPNGSSMLLGGAKVPVSWTTLNMVSDVKIDITVDGGATFTNLIAATRFNAGTEQVTIPNPSDDVLGRAFIRVTNLDNGSIKGDSPAFSVAAMSERYLTFAEVNAIRSGAFPENKQSPSDCVYLGQVDGTRDDVKYAALPRGVLYRIKCTGLTGGRADPESFKGLTLANDWVVSKVETLQGEKIGSATITCALPAVGSSTPAVSCHMVSDRGGFNEFVVAPIIRGRKSTAPF